MSVGTKKIVSLFPFSFPSLYVCLKHKLCNIFHRLLFSVKRNRLITYPACSPFWRWWTGSLGTVACWTQSGSWPSEPPWRSRPGWTPSASSGRGWRKSLGPGGRRSPVPGTSPAGGWRPHKSSGSSPWQTVATCPTKQYCYSLVIKIMLFSFDSAKQYNLAIKDSKYFHNCFTHLLRLVD